MVKYILQLVGWGCFVFGVWYALRILRDEESELIRDIEREEGKEEEEEENEKEGRRDWEIGLRKYF